MKCERGLIVSFAMLFLAAMSFSVSAQDGPSPCDIRPWDSVNNGMGAAPGEVWEFDSGLTVPAECLSNGRAFLPFVEVALTRIASGAPSLEVDVLIRGSDKSGFPTGISSLPNSVVVDGIPIFPAHQVYQIPTLPPGNMNVNNVLWGDYAFIGASFSGDFQGVFIAADQTGPAGETACFAGINGAIPDDPCTNGNPNLNAAGLGSGSYTFYSRYPNSDQVMGREPLGTNWGARYLSGGNAGGGSTTNLRLKEGRGGPIVCEHLDIPSDFEFNCAMTQGQIDKLHGGGIFGEIEIDGVPEEARVNSAMALVFTDGFESGDIGSWTSTGP